MSPFVVVWVLLFHQCPTCDWAVDISEVFKTPQACEERASKFHLDPGEEFKCEKRTFDKEEK